MSLFKAREWWSTTCGEDEGFDQASLCVSSLGKSSSDLIFVGSHSGIIRVFCPSLPNATNAPGYHPKDLLIETNLLHPILQLQVGRFISGSQELHLAVLHSQSVAVYSLVVREGNAEHGEQSALVLGYEHQLKKSLYSLVCGPFGGARGRDFLCIQSLDGTLLFYEQETFVFSRQLPDFLLPGPLIFLPSTDAFITSSSFYNVESYRYQSLAEASDGSDKLVTAEWSLNIGETAIDIISIAHSASEMDVFVLGEHNLFCIRDNGTLKFMRRFEFQPRCFHVYQTDPEGLVMVLLSTDTGTLLVLNNTTLRWSAQLPFPPVALCRAALQDMEGVVVLLSDTGIIQCCYMGTEPSLFVAPSVEPRPIDYQDAERELNYLSNIVREFNDSSSLLMVNSAAERELKLSIKVSQHPEIREDTRVCFIAVDLMPHSAHVPLNKVQVTIVPQPPLMADPPLHSIPSLCEDYQVASYVMLKAGAPECVWSMEVTIVVSYMTGSGVPRVVHTSCHLPLSLIALPCSPAKEADIKVILNVSISITSLLELFPEFVAPGSGPNCLGFLFGSAVVTLMTAKMSSRYRLQSDSVYPLAVLIKYLLHRLDFYVKTAAENVSLKINLISPLPLPLLLTEIEDHFRKRKCVNQIQEDIAQLSQQFRAIQRRLLTKMKDKKPTPLNQLDTLLFATQDEIISTSHSLDEALKDLEHSQWRLSCAVELMHVLLQLSNVNSKSCGNFRAALSPHLLESEDHGWEDYVHAALQHIAKAMPLSSKQHLAQGSSIALEPVSELSSLSKLINVALEGIINDGNPDQNDDIRKVISPIHEIAELEEEPTVPVGSRLAENRGSSALAKSKSKPFPAQTSDSQVSEDQKIHVRASNPIQTHEDDDVWI